ncbi:hypothetical protein BMS3Abin15_00880 [bacterium BMS3Abin15]|nr:hypothetical protein BMS3Abin15_00880 [bacterium BMS3Abin15]HDH07656.1 hypothetical protein [Candidatus Moranbacteria bacterium]HDZ85321.1 hypothetical protein [Candidatus Moranbacteria bacterium]
MPRNIFKTSPEKAISKVHISSIMMGVLIFIFAFIWNNGPEEFSYIAILQLVLAVPLLFVSSLAYSKIGYRREEIKKWDYLGWHTNTIGNVFVFNVIGLVVASHYQDIAIIYFLFIILLMSIYTIVNISSNYETLPQKIYKFLFFIFFLLALGLFPLIL